MFDNFRHRCYYMIVTIINKGVITVKEINKTQKAVLEYIKDTIGERGVAPSVREIGEAVGLRSTSSVQYNLNALEQAGYIERDPNLKRTDQAERQQSESHSRSPFRHGCRRHADFGAGND